MLFQRLMDPAQQKVTRKEVPTLREFAPRFMDGHARANRQKPSGIAAKEMILRVHLLPAFGTPKARRDQERGRAAAQARAADESTEDGQQRAGRAERAAEEGGGVGRDRAHAVHDQAAAGAERLRPRSTTSTSTNGSSKRRASSMRGRTSSCCSAARRGFGAAR